MTTPSVREVELFAVIGGLRSAIGAYPVEELALIPLDP